MYKCDLIGLISDKCVPFCFASAVNTQMWIVPDESWKFMNKLASGEIYK